MEINERQAVAFDDATFLVAPRFCHIADYKIDADERVVEYVCDFQKQLVIIRVDFVVGELCVGSSKCAAHFCIEYYGLFFWSDGVKREMLLGERCYRDIAGFGAIVDR